MTAQPYPQAAHERARRSLGPQTEARIAAAYSTRALITAKAAAEILGMDVKTLRKITDALLIRATRTGEVRRYAEADLRAYLLEATAPCQSTSPRAPASSNMTSGGRVIGFMALQARRQNGRPKK